MEGLNALVFMINYCWWNSSAGMKDCLEIRHEMTSKANVNKVNQTE